MSFKFEEMESRLPAQLTGDTYWIEARSEILDSLHTDAKGLPMTTSQNLLMERMATTYVLLRKIETDPEVTLTANEIRQNNAQWLAMTSEFNKQLTVGEDKRRSAMIDTIQSIVKNAINTIEDSRIKEDLRKRLAQEFKDAGL